MPWLVDFDGREHTYGTKAEAMCVARALAARLPVDDPADEFGGGSIAIRRLRKDAHGRSLGMEIADTVSLWRCQDDVPGGPLETPATDRCYSCGRPFTAQSPARIRWSLTGTVVHEHAGACRR